MRNLTNLYMYRKSAILGHRFLGDPTSPNISPFLKLVMEQLFYQPGYGNHHLQQARVVQCQQNISKVLICTSFFLARSEDQNLRNWRKTTSNSAARVFLAVIVVQLGFLGHRKPSWKSGKKFSTSP